MVTSIGKCPGKVCQVQRVHLPRALHGLATEHVEQAIVAMGNLCKCPGDVREVLGVQV
eukprot:CAMPEP_0115130848 /NCGR_PEP_ID=MMETSP0227-20121206/52728_1 /TAXON_ID=89957 /ORGANISM="Polarella glacialis, Strain CCMP 1383" /LENGTH=57 /DNA_ID=CAMNT_0002536181 /DNA_START=277 /DNA_END=447 /DNA_ORIENTATION=-